MSILDDYLKGNLRGKALDVGTSLLTRKKGYYKKANILKGVALINKLLSNKRLTEVASDIKDFEANSLAEKSKSLCNSERT